MIMKGRGERETMTEKKGAEETESARKRKRDQIGNKKPK